MSLFCTAARIAAREVSRPKPAGQKPKPWPWQVRLIVGAIIVGTLCELPAGRVILAVFGGLLVACVIAVLAMGFGAAGSGSGRKGPFEEYLEQQEEARRP